MIYERMLAESQRLDKQIQSLTSQLEDFPNGNFFCVRNGKYSKWYFNDGTKQIYIPKKERSFAEKLALQKYLLLLRDDLISEKRAIDFYLRHHKSDVGKAERLITDKSEYLDLLAPHFKPLSEELFEWATSTYEKNPAYPERLTHKTVSGIYVRSKSEVLIDFALYTNKIPFRYECALHLDQMIFYPDFTIRHPESGKTFYYEHFGLMDIPAYYNKAYEKLKHYANHGIVPSVNLITTFETQEHPLSLDTVDKIIEHYFL